MKKRAAPAFLITGNPGSGKSTLMARLVEDIGDRQIAGLSTPEVRRGKVRVGFKMIDLATGEEEILASTWGKGPVVAVVHRSLVGQYRDNGRLVTLTRNNFEELRARIVADLKEWRA